MPSTATAYRDPSRIATVSEGPGHPPRRHEPVEFDDYGRRVVRFHRRFPEPPIECLDVLFAGSVAVAVVALGRSLRFDVDHIELYLRPDDAYRLGDELLATNDWPGWASKAAVVDGAPEDDADLAVILVGARVNQPTKWGQASCSPSV